MEQQRPKWEQGIAEWLERHIDDQEPPVTALAFIEQLLQETARLRALLPNPSDERAAASG